MMSAFDFARGMFDVFSLFLFASYLIVPRRFKFTGKLSKKWGIAGFVPWWVLRICIAAFPLSTADTVLQISHSPIGTYTFWAMDIVSFIMTVATIYDWWTEKDRGLRKRAKQLAKKLSLNLKPVPKPVFVL